MSNPKPGFFSSLKFAWQGLRTGFATERNLKYHLLGLLLNLPLMIFLPVSRTEIGVILLCIGGVITAEFLNTALEKLCDVVQPNFDRRIGQIKDLSAGAVLFFVIITLVVAVIIYLPAVQKITAPFGEQLNQLSKFL